MTAPNGIETSAVGRIVTLAMNQDCWMNSLPWNGRRGSAPHHVEEEREQAARSERRRPAPAGVAHDARRASGEPSGAGAGTTRAAA